MGYASIDCILSHEIKAECKASIPNEFSEIDWFDDESLWTKAQLKQVCENKSLKKDLAQVLIANKQFMFSGHISSDDAVKIEEHKKKITPIYDQDKDCGICLLERTEENMGPIYTQV